MKTPHFQGRRENKESGLGNRILKFSKRPHKYCTVCGARSISGQQLSQRALEYSCLTAMIRAPQALKRAWWTLYVSLRADRDRPLVNRYVPQVRP